MVKKCMKKCTLFLFIMSFIIQLLEPVAVNAANNVTPYVAKMYSTSGTPVYAQPDIYTPIVVIIERFVQINVTGITNNGFFQVDLGGTFYIPGPFLVSKVTPDKTKKQIALEQIDDFTLAYTELLEQLEPTIPAYTLMDITGDGVPELLLSNKKEIYTYYDKHPVVVYYCQEPTNHYYNKKTNTFLGKYNWLNNDVWEVYYLDTGLLPWGQLKCFSTDASAYKGDAKPVEYNYSNNASTRADIKRILTDMLVK